MSDGGPAFPIPVYSHSACIIEEKRCRVSEGMTLRDYFAAQTMNGVLQHHLPENERECEHLAMRSYKMADAMLKAREETK